MVHSNYLAALLLVFFLATTLPQSLTFTAFAQDILRQRQQPQQPQQPSQQNPSDPLANLQLPPQLASLTPEQLHHLAALRELQIQQQQQQQAGASATASPALAPTTNQPNGQVGSQIPQPSFAASQASNNDSTNRHDDGSYNETEMAEMEGVAGDEQQNAGGNSAAQGSSSAQQSAPTFEVNWNKCPQLEPSESEKNKKTQVITSCLQSAPIPNNLTRENVEAHREQIATCALKAEGWFDDKGSYKYEKAESEIRAKKLDSHIEVQVLKFHIACKDEASKKFPREQNKLIDQVQFYQACMDYYISIVCEIEVSVDQ